MIATGAILQMIGETPFYTDSFNLMYLLPALLGGIVAGSMIERST